MIGSGFGNIFKIPELKKRIFYTLGLLVGDEIKLGGIVNGVNLDRGTFTVTADTTLGDLTRWLDKHTPARSTK